MRQFILGLRSMPQIETLIVHCHAGKSRSATVAKFAAELFSLPFDRAYDGYNTTVYELLHNPNKYIAFYPWRIASTHSSQDSGKLVWIGWIKVWFASLF